MFKISELTAYIKNNIGWMPFVFAIIMYATAIGIQLWPTATVAYATMCLFAVYAFFNGRGVESGYMAFLLYLPIELLLAQPPELFNCWVRMPLFAIVLICFSPFIKSPRIRDIRHNVMMAFGVINVLVAISSFFCFFLGINMMPTIEQTNVTNTGGSFGGITWHSMTLAPLSAMASVYLSHLALTTKKKIFWVLDIMAIGSLFFASSRSALLAMIAGQIVVFYYQSDKKTVFFKRVLIVVILLAVSYPLWKMWTSGFEAKNAAGMASSSTIFATRVEKWSYRVSEFMESPIFGVGIPAVGLKDSWSYNEHTGVIEPGSSWLSVLSMTGIIGALFIFSFFYKATTNALHSNSRRRPLYLATLVVFMVHLFAEGYIFSGGSFLCVYLWTAVGACYDLKYYNNE